MRFSRRRSVGLLLAVALFGSAGQSAWAQELSPDEKASLVLTAARRAYHERNYPFAADRFRDFLKDFGGHRDAPQARYGLALAMLELPNRDWNAVIEQLNQAVNADFPDRPVAQFYLGSAQRTLGNRFFAESLAKPQEAQQHLDKAKPKWEEAAKQFAAAAGGFSARIKTPPVADAKALPIDLEWATRARCDQAEMLLRLGRHKEAAAIVDPLLAGKLLTHSKYRKLASYLAGYAAYGQRDYLAAGRALAEAAPFDDPGFGLHARYLLGRTHHLADERPEAAAHYEAVIAGYEAAKKAAPQALQTPAAKENFDERARLESLTRDPPPDYVARSAYHLGLLLYEDAKFGESLGRFAEFTKQFPKSPLVVDAQLRQGICQVQLRSYAEAQKLLQPLQEHPQLSDQALWWLARAQIGAADVTKRDQYVQSVKGAVELLRKAAERAEKRVATEPEAKIRRGDILLDQADAQQLAGLYREASATYETVFGGKLAPDRLEEALQRSATALHLAGAYPESDAACKRFQDTFPKSTLLPAVLFRSAENAFAVANATISKNKNLPSDEASKQFAEAIKRYQSLLDKYPEFTHVSAARQGIGLSHYRLGRFDDCAKMLATIPESDRQGVLSDVSFVLADCLLNTLPTDTSDAIAAGALLKSINEASKQLESYVGSQTTSPLLPDALVKLGQCRMLFAAQMAPTPERQAKLQEGRLYLDRATNEFKNSPAYALATLERANCHVMQGDIGGGINELNKFQQDPLKASPIAPLALARQGALMRAQNRAADAVKLLAAARGQYENSLLNDPARRPWAALLQYQHALAIKETGKPTEAAPIFDGVVKQFAGRVEAVEAAYRLGQCRKEEQLARLDAERKKMQAAGNKPEAVQAFEAQRADVVKQLLAAAQTLHAAAAAVPEKLKGLEPQLRLHYEAAWCFRAAGEQQAEAALATLQREADQKFAEGQKAAGNPTPGARAPQIAASTVPMPEGEKQARAAYKALIEAGPEVALASDARLELADLLTARDEHAPAIEQLEEAAQRDLPQDQADKVALRLGQAYLATDQAGPALEKFEPLLKNPKHPLFAEARYRSGEALLRQKEWAKAAVLLATFRDQGEFHNVPGVSDRALLRLGQAYGELKQWDPSRQAYETLVNRFGNSPWMPEARYGIGWAFQNQKQHDNAVNAYNEVTKRTTAEVAARAQLQIGLCRFDQKRYPEAIKALMLVPYTYQYPEISAAALYQAAVAQAEAKQPDDAVRLLRQVAEEYGKTKWAELARQQLEQVKK